MSWISEFAGKAEKILNKIDHNAAIILKNEAKSHSINQVSVSDSGVNVSEAKCERPEGSPSLGERKTPLKAMRTSHSTPMMSTLKREDDTLIEFLNNSAAVDIDQLQMLTAQETHVNGHSNGVNGSLDSVNILELTSENQMLRNEIRSVNSELSLLLNRTKNAEREVSQSAEKMRKYEANISRLEGEVRSLQDKLKESEKSNHGLESDNKRLKEINEKSEANSVTLLEIEATKAAAQSKKREEALRADLLSTQARLEAVEKELTSSKSERHSEIEEITVKLNESRLELEHYRSKALRTLHEKDKLIAELRNLDGAQNTDKIVSLELEQLRKEKTSVMEDCEELQSKLETVRSQVTEAERRLDAAREEGSAQLKKLEVRLAEETARRIAAEEHCTTNAEDLHAVREELSRQITHLTQRVRERDSELNRLRAQIVRQPSRLSPPPDQVEERVSNLTSALVRKQADLEQVTQERNGLRLQLDQTKTKFRQYISQTKGRTISVNDTDDAKLQIPTFLLESPFDTNMTRRVKRAYSSLDAVSIRTGVFLRRYPLARIFVLCYIVLLHFWVCLVLFSRTPDTKL